MTPLQSFVLGIVEGVTEYLPVSSTGHLILTSWMLGLGKEPEQKEAIDAFEIIIQAGAILAVVGLYRSTLWHMVLGVVWRVRGGAAESAGGAGVRGAPPLAPGLLGVHAHHAHMLTPAEGWTLARNVLVAFIPALVLGGLFGSKIKAALFFPWPVICALAVGGAAMLVISPWQKRRLAAAAAGAQPRTTLTNMSVLHSLAIGSMQCAAMWPGTSRSLMTILAGLIIGLGAVDAAKFSFLLGLVTLCAASGKETLDILRHGNGQHFVDQIGGWLPLAMGLLAAWASAALAVDLFVAYLGRHTLALFGWWRLALAAVCAAFLLFSSQAPTLAP